MEGVRELLQVSPGLSGNAGGNDTGEAGIASVTDYHAAVVDTASGADAVVGRTVVEVVVVVEHFVVVAVVDETAVGDADDRTVAIVVVAAVVVVVGDILA